MPLAGVSRGRESPETPEETTTASEVLSMKRPIPEIDVTAVVVVYTGFRQQRRCPLHRVSIVVYLGVYAPFPYSRQENPMPFFTASAEDLYKRRGGPNSPKTSSSPRGPAKGELKTEASAA